ncbi:hypothetical protein PSHT_08068 [Puccinia striiformis]|uniref:Uncharacterized protein n=1 Tax=Puccinia striiformis TaxID=27350 RepID=A0A2S4VSN3_9BASI|nr:hypothetical protein PSHT_08068 [Puccinia striiformis]
MKLAAKFLNYDIKYRTIMRGNVENGQRIDELTENISRVELKFDTLTRNSIEFSRAATIKQHPATQIKQEELMPNHQHSPSTRNTFMKDP